MFVFGHKQLSIQYGCSIDYHIKPPAFHQTNFGRLAAPSLKKINRAHVFGCPVYVLDAALQDGHKIPKWPPRARLGIFLGFSTLHSLLVPLVMSVVTGKISPQFHVIFDDKFETLVSANSTMPMNEQWRNIFRLGCECYGDVDYDATG